MQERYNVYFAGQVMAGHELGSVRDKLAKLFNADQTTLEKLFSGKPQLIKRECDAATAQKFKSAMERAGALPIVKVAEAAATTPAAAPARPMTAAEKIAALAAAPDETRFKKPTAASANAAPDAGDAALGGIALAPPAPTYCAQKSAPGRSSATWTRPASPWIAALHGSRTYLRLRRRRLTPAT